MTARGRPGQPDLGRGHPRRRAGGADLGRRPAHRGRGGGAAGRHRRAGRRRSREFGPGPGRRLGVLVDHLVPGSKESRIVAGVDLAVRAGHRPPVRRRLAGGQAGRGRHPGVAGGPAGPAVEGGRLRGRSASPSRPTCGGGSWPRCDSYQDVETPLINSMERLIDFVTEPRLVRARVGVAGVDERRDVQRGHGAGLVAAHLQHLAVVRAGAAAPPVGALRREPRSAACRPTPCRTRARRRPRPTTGRTRCPSTTSARTAGRRAAAGAAAGRHGAGGTGSASSDGGQHLAAERRCRCRQAVRVGERRPRRSRLGRCTARVAT